MQDLQPPGAAVASGHQVLSVPEAGKLLGLGRDASYQAAKRGELPVLRFGKRLVVPRAALERMLQEAWQK